MSNTSLMTVKALATKAVKNDFFMALTMWGHSTITYSISVSDRQNKIILNPHSCQPYYVSESFEGLADVIKWADSTLSDAIIMRKEQTDGKIIPISKRDPRKS